MKYAGFDISSTLNLCLCLCNLNVSYINLFGNIIILLNYFIISGKVIFNFKNIYLTNFNYINSL